MSPRLLFLDAETYYDDEYSLSKMPTPNYILDPRFELQMVAVHEEGCAPEIIDGPDFDRYLAGFDPKNTVTVTFNSLFDNSILSWRYGFVPKTMIDTMGIARALRGHLLTSASLDSVSKHLGLPPKLKTLAKVKGMRRAEIMNAGMWPQFMEYALDDNAKNRFIFYKLAREFPAAERRLMDLVLRCTIEPKFRLDSAMLTQHLHDIREDKARLLQEAGTTVEELMSNVKFKSALEARGVTVAYKKSATTGRDSPAFAKTDKFMADLQEHEDPAVQALVAARLGHKSTLEETRSEKLLSIAALNWPSYCHGNMPIPLGYGKTHTHRLAGEWGMNMQNLPSGRTKGSKLRRALITRDDEVVIAADLGQIEARLTAWIAGEQALLTQFRNKLDPYAIMGGAIFGYAVDPKVHKVERFIGKTAVLGLGYGCGATKFYDMALKLARLLGVSLGEIWTPELAQKSVDTYRNMYGNIRNTWYKLDNIIAGPWLGKGAPVQFGPVEIGYGYVKAPNDLYLRYHEPRLDDNGEFVFTYGKTTHKIYGAKLLENIVQFLARIIAMNAGLRISDRGYNFVLQAHDELVFIVKRILLDEATTIIQTEMTRPPSWARDLPITADVKCGLSYGEAK